MVCTRWGVTGAPFENREETTVHRFEELKKWLPHVEELGCTAVYIGPLFESSTTVMIPEIISR